MRDPERSSKLGSGVPDSNLGKVGEQSEESRKGASPRGFTRSPRISHWPRLRQARVSNQATPRERRQSVVPEIVMHELLTPQVVAEPLTAEEVRAGSTGGHEHQIPGGVEPKLMLVAAGT